jgi:hypothetical protein
MPPVSARASQPRGCTPAESSNTDHARNGGKNGNFSLRGRKKNVFGNFLAKISPIFRPRGDGCQQAEELGATGATERADRDRQNLDRNVKWLKLPFNQSEWSTQPRNTH